MKMRCVDPVSVYAGGTTGNFYDNGHYVGHDEPSVKFESTAPGSANNITWFQQLSKDPAANLTRTTTPLGTTVSDYAVLSPAPWFGLPLCDPNSFPNGACAANTPSDTNTTAATGSAFMELQFYPPGYGPFPDNVSIDATRWAVALNIDSLECAGNTITGCGMPNPNCVEPVNFALLTHDGVPTGPPSPQSANGATFASNADTLLMNPGDTLRVIMKDIPDAGSPSTGGFKAEVDDLTTGVSGFVIASAANGFMNTNNVSCAGTAFSFHAEYSTASQGNETAWAALEGGVLMQDEIGHSEPCNSLSGADAVSVTAQNFSDAAVMAVCTGPFEAQNGAPAQGEGPCGTGQPTSSNCPGATTEGTTYTTCPTGGGNCEQSDGYCIPAGSRPVTLNGNPTTWTQPINNCQDNQTQNGDLDYDGSAYNADWPDGSANHPTSFRYLGPFDAAGNQYPSVQWETDAAGSEQNCTSSSSNTPCKVPPDGAGFYPFWSMTNLQGLDGITTSSTPCVWNFGNDIAGITTSDFAKDTQYGSSGTHFFGTDISAVTPNPTTNSNCPNLTLSNVTVQNTSTPEVPWAPLLVLGGVAVAGTAGYRRQRRAREA
jgi:hypothetical protein